MIEELHRESDSRFENEHESQSNIHYLVGREEIMIGNETLGRVQEYTYLGRIISANPAHQRKLEGELEWNGVLW